MSLKIAVLTVGDELLNGEIADGNTRTIAAALNDHGYRLRDSLSVGDVELDIQEALLSLLARRDVLIVTGGLGPTGDDRTARAAAKAFDRRLLLHDTALEQIRGHFCRLGQPMHPHNEKQALLPQNATILANSCGSAPGFLLHYQGKSAFFLPGVPAEMAAMLAGEVLPRLAELGGGDFPSEQRVIKLFGLSEPGCEERLAGVELPAGVEVAFGVDFPEVHLKLRASGPAAGHQLDRAEVIARRALDDFVVAVGEETLAGNVARLLIRQEVTLALAESCTGGLIAKRLTDIPGASRFLERGAVVYANRAKEDWLGVPAPILAGPGAVSAECARAMARGIRRTAGVDIGLAVTGIAGPEGGTPEKPVGTVFLALAAAETERVEGFRFGGSREAIRILSAVTALDWLRRHALAPPRP